MEHFTSECYIQDCPIDLFTLKISRTIIFKQKRSKISCYHIEWQSRLEGEGDLLLLLFLQSLDCTRLVRNCYVLS